MLGPRSRRTRHDARMGLRAELQRGVGRWLAVHSWQRSALLAIALSALSRGFLFTVFAANRAVSGSGQSWADMTCKWDCEWYVDIIESGYAPHERATGGGNWAFFPGFPMVANGLHRALGLSPLTAGVVVSLACFTAGLAVLHDYCSRRMDPVTASWVVAFFAFSPFSLYFSSAFSEGVFFFATAIFLRQVHQQRWASAGLAAALMTASRPTGVVAELVLLLVLWEAGALRRRPARSLMVLAAGGSGVAAFMVYLQFAYGDALAFYHVQASWDRSINRTLYQLGRAVLLQVPDFEFIALCLLITCFAMVYLRQAGYRNEALVLGFSTLVPAATALMSVERYAFANAPIYVALALLTRRARWARPLLLAGLMLGMVWFARAWLLGWQITG